VSNAIKVPFPQQRIVNSLSLCHQELTNEHIFINLVIIDNSFDCLTNTISERYFNLEIVFYCIGIIYSERTELKSRNDPIVRRYIL